VDFEDNPDIGIGEDNIWTFGDSNTPQFIGDDGPPVDIQDAYLVNEYQDGTLPP
jgi:hypothetical protein